MSPFLQAFPFMAHNVHLLETKVQTHVVISVESIAIAIAISVPLGVFLGHLHRYSFVAINTSNIGRAIPSVALLAILLPFIGIGRTPVIVALVVLAVPPILTNAYVAVEQVEADTVDAAKGIGLRPWQVLAKVEMPLALPLIFAGIRTSSVFVVATATLAGIFGGGGLGDIVVNREGYGEDGVLAATYLILLLALVAFLLFAAVEWAVTPAGLRASHTPGRRLSGRRQTGAVLSEGVLSAEHDNLIEGDSPHASDQTTAAHR
jgi:osmoprotectant transport system permease protein